MSLAFGREQLSIPGPSVIPDRVLRAMQRPAPNIYTGEIVETSEQVFAQLNQLARNDGQVVMHIGNGHAAWESSLCNVFSRGDKALGLINGRFGLGWIEMAEKLGIAVQRLPSSYGQAADPAAVEAALRADSNHDIKAVMTVQTDTSTSIDNDIPAIRQAMDAAGHPALLMVDCIATFGCQPFQMQAWNVDIMVAACQKGLMTPPGLAITFLRERAWDAWRSADLRTPYWDWDARVNAAAFPMQYGGTPPTHHLYALKEALDMIEEEGAEQVWRRHRLLARCVWTAIDAWSRSGSLRCLVPDVEQRSTAVTTVVTGNGAARRIREWCDHEAGVVLGVGLGESPDSGLRDDLFRIGHMGHLNPPMLLGTLATIDTSLKALDIAHGSAAIEAVTEQLSVMMNEQ